MEDVIVQGCSRTGENRNEGVIRFSLFRRGLGKMVSVKESPLAKASSIFGEDVHTTTIGGVNQGRAGIHISSLNETGKSEVMEKPNGLGDDPAVPAGSFLSKEPNPNQLSHEIHNPIFKEEARIKFQTAGGRFISVSINALQRARSLLGESELGDCLDDGLQNASHGSEPCTPFSNRERITNQKVKSFTSPLLSSSVQNHLPPKPKPVSSLIKEFDAVGSNNGCDQQNFVPESNMGSLSLPSGSVSRMSTKDRSSDSPLVNITNTVNPNNRQAACEKRRFGRVTSVSPFKRPRSSNSNNTQVCHDGGFSSSTGERFSCEKKVFCPYPFQVSRKCVREFFTNPPTAHRMLNYVSNEVRQVQPGNSAEYIFFNRFGLHGIGADGFFHMLANCGASTKFASKGWVRNHYKWIIWKLACYERCCRSATTCFLNVPNVLEELKYRYEREVNHGHKSAIKRILEGKASPSRMIILCISSVHLNKGPKNASSSGALNDPVKIELTDGWYSITALLDTPLSMQLSAKKLFVGQKLRIWGARLCGWAGPVSPLEVSTTVNLLLNINGTYRADWAERLGFCKHVGPPLAFRCIKVNGGLVPQTVVGVTRIYPMLYKERLGNGDIVVRSERMESHMMQLHRQRSDSVIDRIISELEWDKEGSHVRSNDQSAGAKNFEMVQTSQGPDILLTDTTVEQLKSFNAYSPFEAKRNWNMDKSVVRDDDFQDRDVTPFMMVRVVGLNSKCCQDEKLREGMICIWDPTEKQRSGLVEGQAYVILGLEPTDSDSDVLQLHINGPSGKWQPLSPKSMECFKPFFKCRESISLSSLEDIPLSGEFDIAAHVVHVGEVYRAANTNKQWVFVTDGSISGAKPKNLSNSLLAINFCTPLTDDDDDSFVPFDPNLAGTTVGICNLIKRSKDRIHGVCLADATENSTYYLSFDSPECAHLRNAANSVHDWANISKPLVDKTRDEVLFIMGGGINYTTQDDDIWMSYECSSTPPPTIQSST